MMMKPPMSSVMWMTTIMLMLMIMALSTVTTTAQEAIDERSILLDLYTSTGGHAWNENYGWANNLDNICDWHGVICVGEDDEMMDTSSGTSDGGGDDERRHHKRFLQNGGGSSLAGGGQVIGLKLNANFLTGRTPATLWQLPSLMYLDMSYNPNLDVDFVGLTPTNRLQELHLRQTATTSVTGLSAIRDTLEIVNLSENDINTRFPPDLYELTKLTILELGECNLQGSLPDDIHRLSGLHELNLYRNSFTGTLPSGLSRLVHLRHLGLSNNQLHGTLPTYLNELALLQQLWVSNNDMTGSIPSFANSPDIHKIFLNGNSFSGELPVDFLQAVLGGPNTFSITVNLKSNEFTGPIPSSIDRLAPLEMSWEIGNNKWDGIPAELCDNVNWNNGNIEEFGCYGLACPPGSYARSGHQTFEAECEPCTTAEYYGATNCFDKDDASVLRELYIALDGERWDRNDNWMQSSNVCDWYGVQCWDIGDAKDGRVRWVNLPNNNLRGEVPETIWSMEHLTTLDLSRNEITLSFRSISESTHIYSVNVASTKTRDYDGIEDANTFFKRLFADQTPIGGTIPGEILSLSNLEVLSLQECDLAGQFPLGLFDGMTSLQALYLTDNNLQGDLPDRWASLPNLEVLALAKNRFQGPLPPSFDTAASLQAVSLSDQMSKGGGLVGSIPSYATTRTLSKLAVAQNTLEGELPEDFLASVDGATPLMVDVANNEITGTIHSSWERFTQLDLYATGNKILKIDEGLCDNIGWMSGAVADFGCNAILCPAGSVGGRQEFDEGSCRPCYEQDPPPEDESSTYLGQIACAQDTSVTGERAILELIYQNMGGASWRSSDGWMSNNNICTWYGVDCDENGSVSSIQLGSNQLVGPLPTEVYQLTQLKHLKLHSNTVYMTFDGIEQAENLETMSLDDTGLDSLTGIGRARSLREFSASRNNLRGPLPEEMSRLINVRNLDLSHNRLSGFLPFWLRSLVSLATFTASHNEFSGPVNDFAALRELRYLDLSNNRLTGSLPPSLLSGVPPADKVVCDLSHNRISGTVPSELSGLSRLSLQLQDNEIDAIDPALCEVEGMNDYDVLSFGCNGILCPAGTFNTLGRQTNEDVPCSPCNKVTFMGATHCGKSSSSATSFRAATAISFSVLAWAMSTL